MAFHPVRAFVLLSLTLNGAMAMALTGALAFGLRAVTIFDVLAISAFLLGFFNAVGDLIEAEAPALTSAPPSDEDDAASKPAGLNVSLGVASDRRAGSPGVRPLGIDTAATSDDLSAFAPEQRHTRRS